MCAQFEREDVLQVYILPGRPLCTLSEAQQDELIAQADRRIKAQTGKGLMPQLTKNEVRELFDEVPRSPEGTMRFHEMQRKIVAFREERIKRLKVMYPVMQRKASGRAALRSSFGASRSAVSFASSRRSRRSVKVSPDVAPATMFQKNKGLTNNSISTHTNHLLSTRAYKICDIEAGNSFELTANVRLIRENRPRREVGDPWDCVSKRPSQEQAKLRMLATLRDGARATMPARGWSPTRAV